MANSRTSSTAKRIEYSVAAVEEAAEVVGEAASRFESNVVEGIRPDITELRMYFSELSEAANLRQKRLTWAVAALAAVNLAVLALVLFRGI